MSPATNATAPKRRTQAERTASTQAALLDATVDCLVEYGYAHTTTARIVERAGVSRGAQVHHFPTKAALVAEAVRHLAKKRSDEFFEDVVGPAPSGRRRLEAMLDLVWDLHMSPLFVASMELYVAARTDPELRARLGEVEREVNAAIIAGTAELFPDRVGDRAFREALDAALAAVRGTALLTFIEEPGAPTARRWPAVRRQLLKMSDEA